VRLFRRPHRQQLRIVDSIRARMAAASLIDGKPLAAAGGNLAGTPAGYRSRSEMKRDMPNPEYQRDPAFRQAVAERMRVATLGLDCWLLSGRPTARRGAKLVLVPLGEG
jgi:hypothetical protein